MKPETTLEQTMGIQSNAKTFTLLIVLSCLVPVAVMVAILSLNVPVWQASLVGLIVLSLLARRIFALLSTPGQDESSPPSSLGPQNGPASYDRHPR